MFVWARLELHPWASLNSIHNQGLRHLICVIQGHYALDLRKTSKMPIRSIQVLGHRNTSTFCIGYVDVSLAFNDLHCK